MLGIVTLVAFAVAVIFLLWIGRAVDFEILTKEYRQRPPAKEPPARRSRAA